MEAEALLEERWKVPEAAAMLNIDQIKEEAERPRTAALQEHHTEAMRVKLAETQAAAVEEGGLHIADMEKEMSSELLNRQVRYREELQERLNSLQQPLFELDRLSEVHLPHWRLQSSIAMSKALEALKGALLEGREATEELQTMLMVGNRADRFTSQVLSLLPAGILEWCQQPVPTDLQLKLEFKAQLPHWVEAAFTPREDDEFSERLGRLFGRFYALSASGTTTLEVPVGEPPPQLNPLKRNLEALAQASRFVEVDDFRSAARLLEVSLTGRCRASSTKWVHDARNMLLLRQASWLLQARSCLIKATLV